MKLQVEVVLVCLISLIGIEQIHCVTEELPDTSGVNNWACTCSSAYQGNQSFVIGANCSTSCECNPVVGGSGENRWTCICGAEGFPEVATGGHGTSCFTSCNCTSGSLNEAESSKKWLTSKVVVIILLLCVSLTTFAFIASVLCYVCRKDKCPTQPPLSQSDKETSCNSATNLISHGANTLTKPEAYICSPTNPITGCIQKASFLFRGKPGIIHGTIRQFSYFELENATNKFSNSNLIGIGSSSHVYHGNLKDGRIVAVKRLKTQRGPDSEAVFLTEIDLISRLHHCHVVPLLGYCSENQGKHIERLLVFEYMPNGNLRESLDGALGKCLDWGTRVAIALGAARGLEYLHEAVAPSILHRDVKSSNILLDENWRAKATPHLQDSRRVILELPDPHLKKNFPKDEMQVMAYLAKECLLLDPDSRPTMSEVVQILSTIAPEKSRRRNFSLNIFQSSTYSMEGEAGIERPDKQDVPVEAEELKQVISDGQSAQHSLPLDIDLILCTEKSRKISDTISAEGIKSLIVSTSHARSWHCQDDELVDLTAPRFESFCMENVQSSHTCKDATAELKIVSHE